MRVLIGCEESQAVCKEFRRLGHEAYSCDIQECSGGHPEWHIQDDIFQVINGGAFTVAKDYSFADEIIIYEWDMMIAFPPCTDLAVSGASWFEEKRNNGKQAAAITFFMELYTAPIKRIAIENPIGIISGDYVKSYFPEIAKKYGLPVKYSQLIHPYYFGDEAQKSTCLWLKKLPLLYHNKTPNLFDLNVTHVKKGEMMKCVRKDGRVEYRARHNQGLSPSPERGKIRSKTFPGIARAMAEQWGGKI